MMSANTYTNMFSRRCMSVAAKSCKWDKNLKSVCFPYIFFIYTQDVITQNHVLHVYKQQHRGKKKIIIGRIKTKSRKSNIMMRKFYVNGVLCVYVPKI